jgi:predicted Zn-dependent protease
VSINIALSCASNAFAQSSGADDASLHDREERVYNTLKEVEPLIKDKKFVEARRMLKEAATLDPTTNSGALHSNLAFVDQQLGDLEEAIAENKSAMQFDPKSTDLTWNIAIAYKDLGDYDKAREWVRQYLQTNPSDPKRVQEAQGLYKKLGEQAGLNGSQSIHAADYLDALVVQHGAGRWPRQSFPLKVFVEKSEGIPGVPTDSMRMLESSFDAWNKASGGLLQTQFVSKSKQADITIRWTNKPDKVSAHDGVHVEQGITRVMTAVIPGAQIGTIRSADIMLLTVSRETGEPIAEDDMEGVCLHEIGHALGLGGHSSNSADTMYFSTSARQLPALSHRDKSTIVRLYSFTPQNVQQMPYAMNSNRGPMPPFAQLPYQQNQATGNLYQQNSIGQQPGYSNMQPYSFSGNSQSTPTYMPNPYIRNPYMPNPYMSNPSAQPFQQPYQQNPYYQQPLPFPQAPSQQPYRPPNQQFQYQR